MDKLLTSKVALITGGTRGIGKAIACAFAKEGASLALFGVNPERGNKVVEEMKPLLQREQKIAFYPVDVGDSQAVDQAIADIIKEFGAIDILVNNAGITRDALLIRMDENAWDEVIRTNLKSAYNTCHAVVRSMMKARSGKIINITSVSGQMGNAGQTNYAASKAGMIGFTKSLAKEMGSRGISVNCISPGFIKTDMTDVLSDAQKESLVKMIPLNRLGETSDVASAALFLSCDLSGYITGQVLNVDGGMVMQG